MKGMHQGVPVLDFNIAEMQFRRRHANFVSCHWLVVLFFALVVEKILSKTHCMGVEEGLFCVLLEDKVGAEHYRCEVLHRCYFE